MTRWAVLLLDGEEETVLADRMTITDGGTLIFWCGHAGQCADAIFQAFADGQWSVVVRLPESPP